MPDQFVPHRRSVSRVEDQVQDRQHSVYSLQDGISRRNLVGDPGIPDFALGPHEPLRHGRQRNEKGAGNLRRRQAAQGVQGQCHLRFFGEGGMTAGKDQF